MATKTSKATRDKGKSTAAPSDTKAQSTTASPVTATSSATPPTTQQPDGSAIDALKQDHRRVEQLFAEFEEEADGDRKDGLVQEICRELIIHTKLEEEIFYPACREGISEEEMLDEAQVEHDSAKSNGPRFATIYLRISLPCRDCPRFSGFRLREPAEERRARAIDSADRHRGHAPRARGCAAWCPAASTARPDRRARRRPPGARG